jgi:hypothetical protein
MATPLHHQTKGQPIFDCRHGFKGVKERAGEWFWLLFSFVLFLVLGPFSAPIVLIAIFRLGLENSDQLVEPESITAK